MINFVKQRIKNEKGLTLIELLAVVVILGIIAAIAIPAIGGLIDNSRKDAHVANAQQMINSAKLFSAGNGSIDYSGDGHTLTLKTMVDDGLIEDMKDPDGDSSYPTQDDSFVTIKKADTGKGLQYSVYLKGSEKKVSTTDDKPVLEKNLKRSLVQKVE